MQIKKIYRKLQPELLYTQLKEFFRDHSLLLVEDNPGTFSNPNDSSVTLFRGSLTFRTKDNGEAAKRVKVQIQGTMADETRLLLDIEEGALTEEQSAALHDQLDFFLGSYEVKPD